MASMAKNRSLSIVGMAVVAVILVATTGIAFINASSAGAIARNSELLHWSNVTAGTAAVSRATISQAIVFAVDDQLDVAPAEAARLAIEEASTALDSLLGLAATAPIALADEAADTEALGRAGQRILALLEAHDILSAESALDDEFEFLYAGVASGLANAQRAHAAAIDDAESVAGRIEGALRWLVTLFIPALAILLHRSIIQRKYRERRVELAAELEAQRRLGRAKDEFIAGISHELRTPLTSILGFSDHLMDAGMADEAETIELIGLINQDSEELERMVEDLLTAARLEAEALTFDYTAVDILEQVRSVVARFARQGLDIRVTGTADLTWADGPRVRQIVRNLVSNAVRHGGPEIAILVTTEGDNVICEVSDNGPGVSAEVEERLFERFVHDGKTTLLTGSVGLGLSIGRALAQTMGGDVRYDRRHDWTFFTVELPRASDVKPPALQTETEEPASLPLEELVTVSAASTRADNGRVISDSHA